MINSYESDNENISSSYAVKTKLMETCHAYKRSELFVHFSGCYWAHDF